MGPTDDVVDETGEVEQSAPRTSLVLLGRPGVTLDVVAYTLRVGGELVIDLASLEEDPAARVVAVVVRPSENDWAQIAQLRADPIVVLDTDDVGEVAEAVIRGAEAVITTRSEPADLIEAVRIVGDGGSVLAPDVARNILQHLRTIAAQRPVLMLTPRETDILMSIERGDSIKQTARALGISVKTVQNLQSRLFNKLRARNRAQAITRAHELGLLRTLWIT